MHRFLAGRRAIAILKLGGSMCMPSGIVANYLWARATKRHSPPSYVESEVYSGVIGTLAFSQRVIPCGLKAHENKAQGFQPCERK